jgi:hypothetical protein
MDYKPGDLITLRVIDVQPGVMCVQIEGKQEAFWILEPPKAIKPPTSSEYRALVRRSERALAPYREPRP